MKEISESFDIPHSRHAKHGNAFWTIFLGILLFMMLSVILLTSLNNFVLTSQTRNMLLEIKISNNQDVPINQKSTTIKTGFSETTQATPETTPSETTTKLSSETSTNSITGTTTLTTMSSYITSRGTETNELASTSIPTDASTSSENISTSSELTSDEPVEKINPITLLTYANSFKKYFTCIQSCNNPSIIAAQLNLTLSANRENHLLLKTQVLTESERVAKRRVAYLALNYLYKDRLHEAQTDPEWKLPIGSNSCSGEFQNNTQISC